ncbi:MAG: arginase [Chitinophagales bacterium]|nr:arginase [Chitinophagales bacterium]MDW8427668.1 arginase [Chitinophagales bacterium]
MRHIKILAVESELGAGTRGASLGFEAIRIAALDFGSSFFRQYPIEKIPHENDRLLDAPGSLHARRGPHVMTVCERVMHAVCRTLQQNIFPIVISGDHSTAVGTIAGIRLAYPDARIGVIWIDAHADLHSPYTTPSGNLHGMPLAAALAEDNLAQRINNPDEQTIAFWEAFKKLGGISPKIRYDNLVYVALRDYEPQEEFLIRQNRVKVFTTEEINNLGIDKIGREVLQAVEPCDIIYISFDVDSMDPTISRGTGTPAPNGITEKQAASLLQRLVQSPKICCFEITEVNPTLDRENFMAENAFEILLKVTNQLQNN